MEIRRRLLLAIAAFAFSLDVSAADARGIWRGELKMRGAQGEMRRDVTLSLAVNGSRLTGKMTSAGDPDTAEILDGTVTGNEVYFAVASGADDIPRFEFRGALAGDQLTLTVSGRLKDTGQIIQLGECSLKRSK